MSGADLFVVWLKVDVMHANFKIREWIKIFLSFRQEKRSPRVFLTPFLWMQVIAGAVFVKLKVIVFLCQQFLAF